MPQRRSILPKTAEKEARIIHLPLTWLAENCYTVCWENGDLNLLGQQNFLTQVFAIQRHMRKALFLNRLQEKSEKWNLSLDLAIFSVQPRYHGWWSEGQCWLTDWLSFSAQVLNNCLHAM